MQAQERRRQRIAFWAPFGSARDIRRSRDRRKRVRKAADAGGGVDLDARRVRGGGDECDRSDFGPGGHDSAMNVHLNVVLAPEQVAELAASVIDSNLQL